MKKLLCFISLLLFIISCDGKKSSKNQSDKPSNPIEESFEDKESIDKKKPIKNKQKTTQLETKSGKRFEVTENKLSSSMSEIRIDPKGFAHSEETIRLEDSDPVLSVFCTDLDRNNFAELFIITQSVGSGSYGTIYGFASNKDLSLTPIFVPEMAQSDLAPDAIFYGYRGKDSIYSSKRFLMRTFPVFNEEDANCCPTGGQKTIQYKLKKGEASWRLEAVN